MELDGDWLAACRQPTPANAIPIQIRIVFNGGIFNRGTRGTDWRDMIGRQLLSLAITSMAVNHMHESIPKFTIECSIPPRSEIYRSRSVCASPNTRVAWGCHQTGKRTEMPAGKYVLIGELTQGGGPMEAVQILCVGSRTRMRLADGPLIL